MSTYAVVAKRIHEYFVEVEANSAAEALMIAKERMRIEQLDESMELVDYWTPTNEWSCEELPY